MRHGVIAMFLLPLAGCGGGAALTCELLMDPTNCWAEAAAALRACLPVGSTPATLAGDRTSCSFADGTRVVFDAALPNDTLQLDRLGFTIERGGAPCGRFVDTFMNRMELDVGEHSVVSELHPGGDFHLHCGGTSYETAFETLFECGAFTAPTDGFEVTPTTFSFTIVSVATPGELFRCAP